MQASSKRPKVVSSSGAPPPPPPSSSDLATDAFIDPIAAADPPPFASDVSSIHHTLDIVMTVQATHGQLLVDVLAELQSLRANLASIRWSPPPPHFDDE